MQDWNVIVTVREGTFQQARRFLETVGEVARTDYFNVLTAKVEDVRKSMEFLKVKVEEEPGTLNLIARFLPLSHIFNFQSPEEFQTRAAEAVSEWVPTLADTSFHVRMKRRGFKGHMSSMDEERFLDDLLLDRLQEEGAPGRITFSDPDFIIAVETVGNRGGLSLWSRIDLQRYPFLGLD